MTPIPASAHAVVTVNLPVPETGRYGVVPRMVHGSTVPFANAPPAGLGTLRIGTAKWQAKVVPGNGCQELGSHELSLTAPSVIISIEAEGGAFALDRITLKRRP